MLITCFQMKITHHVDNRQTYITLLNVNKKCSHTLCKYFDRLLMMDNCSSLNNPIRLNLDTLWKMQPFTHSTTTRLCLIVIT